MASAAARPGVTEFSIASDTQVKFVRVVNAPRHLVFEAYTLQVLPPELRASAVAAIAECLAPGGKLLVVARGRGLFRLLGEHRTSGERLQRDVECEVSHGTPAGTPVRSLRLNRHGGPAPGPAVATSREFARTYPG